LLDKSTYCPQQIKLSIEINEPRHQHAASGTLVVNDNGVRFGYRHLKLFD